VTWFVPRTAIKVPAIDQPVGEARHDIGRQRQAALPDPEGNLARGDRPATELGDQGGLDVPLERLLGVATAVGLDADHTGVETLRSLDLVVEVEGGALGGNVDVIVQSHVGVVLVRALGVDLQTCGLERLRDA